MTSTIYFPSTVTTNQTSTSTIYLPVPSTSCCGGGPNGTDIVLAIITYLENIYLTDVNQTIVTSLLENLNVSLTQHFDDSIKEALTVYFGNTTINVTANWDESFSQQILNNISNSIDNSLTDYFEGDEYDTVLNAYFQGDNYTDLLNQTFVNNLNTSIDNSLELYFGGPTWGDQVTSTLDIYFDNRTINAVFPSNVTCNATCNLPKDITCQNPPTLASNVTCNISQINISDTFDTSIRTSLIDYFGGDHYTSKLNLYFGGYNYSEIENSYFGGHNFTDILNRYYNGTTINSKLPDTTKLTCTAKADFGWTPWWAIMILVLEILFGLLILAGLLWLLFFRKPKTPKPEHVCTRCNQPSSSCTCDQGPLLSGGRGYGGK